MKQKRKKRKKINETESSLFIGKINKIDKPIANLIKEKEKEKDINYQFQERQNITTHSTDLKESSVVSISSSNSHQTHFTGEETDTKKVK